MAITDPVVSTIEAPHNSGRVRGPIPRMAKGVLPVRRTSCVHQSLASVPRFHSNRDQFSSSSASYAGEKVGVSGAVISVDRTRGYRAVSARCWPGKRSGLPKCQVRPI